MSSANNIAQPIPFLQKIKIKLFRWFRLHQGPTVKLYRGFGNETKCHVYGHTLSLAPMPRKTYRNSFFLNFTGILRLFMTRPLSRARVQLEFDGQFLEAKSEKDGFFHFEWKPVRKLLPGTYPVKAIIISGNNRMPATATSTLIIPWPTDYSFISDIDDTFLVSHSSSLVKRLQVLLTRNARSRKPFDSAIMHYRLLHGADEHVKEDNMFFYVSSSEWNLYDYILEFVTYNRLPQGVFLLNQLKTFSKIFATGQTKHSGKFTRITRIIESFPGRKFVLLGDDSQQDPEIYNSIVSHFPGAVFCVYIRRVGDPEKAAVREKGRMIEAAGTLFYYFAHSTDAIVHSRKIGLIK